jgi:hypothetical protein
VLREFGGRSKSDKILRNKKSLKSIINIIFKNIMNRILAIENLHTILLLVFLMTKPSLKKLMVCLDNFGALFGVA